MEKGAKGLNMRLEVLGLVLVHLYKVRKNNDEMRNVLIGVIGGKQHRRKAGNKLSNNCYLIISLCISLSFKTV